MAGKDPRASERARKARESIASIQVVLKQLDRDLLELDTADDQWSVEQVDLLWKINVDLAEVHAGLVEPTLKLHAVIAMHDRGR